MSRPVTPGCGCRRPDPLATFEREALRTIATADRPREVGRLAVDRAGLRAALGGRAEVVEAMGAKASGRPGVNVARIWSFMTTSVYQSGDLPVLATREALQNGIDAIKAAIRSRKTRAGEGRFAVTWDPSRRALTWEDNGVGMDAETILTKFLSLGDSGKRDAGSGSSAIRRSTSSLGTGPARSGRSRSVEVGEDGRVEGQQLEHLAHPRPAQLLPPG